MRRGRVKDLSRPAKANKAYTLFRYGVSFEDICAFLGVQKRAAYNYIKEGREVAKSKQAEAAAMIERATVTRIANEVVKIAKENLEKVEVFIEMQDGKPALVYAPVGSLRSQRAMIGIGTYDAHADPDQIVDDVEASGVIAMEVTGGE